VTAVAARTFAIGDLHGCVRELERILAAIAPAAGDTIVFVGDYVDRGPDSRATIDCLLDLGRRSDLRTIFLRGNHEDMFLDYLGRDGHFGESFLGNGGNTTLASYDVAPGTPRGEVPSLLPAAHLAFLDALAPLHVDDRHVIVHAGINPARTLTEQTPDDLFWIREEFFERPHSLPQTVVFGHTPWRDVLVDLPYKIGIDTGCVYGGTLTAISLGEGLLYQLRRGADDVRVTPLPRGHAWP
jgi:serine/threonine protein phosphatase 1